MSVFWVAALSAYALFSAAILLFACVDPDGEGVLSTLSRGLYEVPDALVSSGLARAVLGTRGQRILRRCGHYVCEEPNPILQTVYLALVCGGYGAVILVAYPRVPCATLGAYHEWTGLVAFAAALFSFCLASRAPPGYIVDAATEKRHDNYPYDDVLFTSGRACPTTGVRKLARSKFCRTTGLTVARFDHFCPWINQAVGEENYRYFLLFLGLHVILLTYGAAACTLLLWDVVVTERLAQALFFDARLGRTVPATKIVILRYLLGKEKVLTALLAVCLVMGVLVVAFLAYHLWLISRGTTTNEYYKWRAIKNAKNITNIYNRGLLANIGEVLFPLSTRSPTERPPPDAWLRRRQTPQEEDDDDGGADVAATTTKRQQRRGSFPRSPSNNNNNNRHHHNGGGAPHHHESSSPSEKTTTTKPKQS
ncbi:hypothetical protein CTAYLR_008635 [Chrysophaeum taylorii]|uniref:Palmitoyltransferase n=1 Tax=Chrysophaeum taylorii TaxID=2483200 RepID=A0AAD7UHW0_9STRA|nr:hypothetical protein CTAYLR_008635 [Chrysophaeum taylorii]